MAFIRTEITSALHDSDFAAVLRSCCCARSTSGQVPVDKVFRALAKSSCVRHSVLRSRLVAGTFARLLLWTLLQLRMVAVERNARSDQRIVRFIFFLFRY